MEGWIGIGVGKEKPLREMVGVGLLALGKSSERVGLGTVVLKRPRVQGWRIGGGSGFKGKGEVVLKWRVGEEFAWNGVWENISMGEGWWRNK